jgi:hypothetical protein
MEKPGPQGPGFFSFPTHERTVPMGRSSRTSILKRQREIKKAEKAAGKRAKRHGKPVDGFTEPRPTVPTSSAQPSEEPKPKQAPK